MLSLLSVCVFLAAKRSSRSDVITKSVHPFFLNQGVIFKSKMVFQQILNAVSWKLKRRLNEIARVFQESFKCLSERFQGCLQEDRRVFGRSLQGVSGII